MEFPLTPAEWSLATGVLLVCAVIQGSIGFGVGLLGAPLLFLINPQLVPAPVIIVGMVLPMMILVRDWRGVQFSDVGWALPGTLTGTALGAALLDQISADGLSLLFGCLVLLGVAMSSVGYVPALRPRNIVAAGGLSGFMATTTSIGGPPLALAFQTVHGQRLRGTLSAVFFPGGILALSALYAVGRFGLSELLAGLSLLPAITAGFWISGYTARVLDRRWLRPLLLAFSALAGLAAIMGALSP